MAFVLFLTLEGADKVAPEPGLLGEGGVVGVEVEVHLAHSGVAAAHPETQKYAMDGDSNILFLPRVRVRAAAKSEKHPERAKN